MANRTIRFRWEKCKETHKIVSVPQQQEQQQQQPYVPNLLYRVQIVRAACITQIYTKAIESNGQNVRRTVRERS